MQAQDLAALRRIALFAGLPAERLQRLTVDAAVLDLPRGAILLKQGDPPSHVHVVLDGQVGMIGQSSDGEETVVEIFRVGDTFITPAVILEMPYLMSARVIEPARVVLIPGDAFRSALKSDHGLALATVEMLARYWRLLIRQIKELKLKTAGQRVGGYLLSLTAQRSGTTAVLVHGERRVLARRLGMTPESLSRALAGLRAHGVAGGGKRFVIADVRRLREYCQEDDLV
jgi:CRP/FNR family transcriptional activator FtrB